MTVAFDEEFAAVHSEPDVDYCNWSRSPCPMQQMMYVPYSQSDAFACTMGMMPISLFPLQMNVNGQMIPCPIEQNGQPQIAQFQPMVIQNGACSDGTFTWAIDMCGTAPSPCMVDPYLVMVEEQQNLSGCQLVAGHCFQESHEKEGPVNSTHPASSNVAGAEDAQAHGGQGSRAQEIADALGDPMTIICDANLASKVKEWLESREPSECSAIIEWLLPAIVDLSLSSNGTLVVQAAIEVATAEDQEKLIYCLQKHIRRLLDSPHGNFVLQKIVVMMPPYAVQFVLSELSNFGWVAVAKHRYGCRIEQRVLEHCNETLTTPLVDALLAVLDSAAKHPFANYVVQHILEHGSPRHREQAVVALVRAGIPDLARHRVASNIVEKAVQHASPKGQRVLAESILEKPGALRAMACNHYGSFTVRRLLDVITKDPIQSRLFRQLAPAACWLGTSKHGRRILSRFNAASAKRSGYGVGGA